MSEYRLSKEYPHLEVYPCGKIYSRLANKFLKHSLSTYGYHFVSLKFNGEKKGVFVHRLVASAYHENPENKRCVNHIDGVKTNNHYSNLEWCTHQENTRHAIRIGLFKNARKFKYGIKSIRKDFEKIKPWSRTNGLKVWAEKNDVPYKTAKNWYKEFKEGRI